MGCKFSGAKDAQEVTSLSEQDVRIINKIGELASQVQNSPSPAELQFLLQTLSNLHTVESAKREEWLATIHNDIINPLYFSMIENFPYSDANPFIPDQHKLETLRNKDFLPFDKSKDELRNCLLHIYSDFIPLFNIDISKLQRFIFALSENYNDNPFHNFTHAFAVTQMLFSISERANKLQAFLEHKDRLALLVSALGHDLNHPGVTNAYMINTRHQLAVRYNDISVLENYHASTLIHFLELSGCDILESLPLQDRNYMRRQIIPTILATDMAKHFQVIANFEGVMKNFDRENADHRQAVMDGLLHSADVGNPTLRFDIATVYSLRIIQEFNKQVLTEEQKGLPVSEYLRVGNDVAGIKKNQLGFIEKLIYPLWKVVATYIPEAQIHIDTIEDNKRRWEELENLD
ncbi:unnamed protein product [Blepharisma stoltei]|uniref:PDEase domain-containing protein n=1 Tax=Blepharisma stoltei TaxID=1481888 RepID=A0AAU9IZD6_9CILI|nr:unnamed protein product [Blepharisma stoltei]